MDGEAARVADIGDMEQQLQRVDKRPPGLLAALELEAHQRAIATVQIGVGPASLLPVHQARIDRLRDLGVAVQVVGYRGGVAVMPFHAQRQRFQPLQRQEGVHRRGRRAEVAQQGGPGLDDVGDGPERLDRLGPHGAVIARVRFVEVWLALRECLPVEIAAVDQHAADGGAVPAYIFGRGIHDDGRPVVEGPAKQRRGGVVHDERNAVFAPDVGDLPDREDMELRVRQRLRVEGARPVVDGAAEVLGVRRIDEAHFDALVLQRIGEQVPGASVEVGRAHYIVAGMGDVLEGECRRRLARCQRQSRDPAFQRRHSILQHGVGRIHDPRVDIAELAQREQVRGVLGIPELVGRGLVDRDGDRTGVGVASVARMEHDGLGTRATVA